MPRRNDALINGALIGLGLLIVFDNIVFHWILGFHRAIPGPHALIAELVLVGLGAVMIVSGLWREKRARRR